MNKDTLLLMLAELQKVFQTVRLVDPIMQNEITVTDTGDLIRSPLKCYDVWNKQRPCQNCVSAKALAQKSQLTKFEFLNGYVHMVIAKYLEVEGQPYVLELLQQIPNETLFTAFGKTEFIQSLMEFSKTIYIDALTGAYNRKFFEEQFAALENHCAVAFVDIDRFKSINDTYGHDAGDQVLKTVVSAMLANIRPEDIMVRYGGEEFVLSFAQMPKNAFVRRLDELRAAVKVLQIEKYPDIHVTISIGGIYCTNGDRMEMVKAADQLCYEAKMKRDDVKVKIR